MIRYRIVLFLVVLCLVPVSGYGKVYRYIDKDGVERFSNEPPPPGAKIIDASREVTHDAAADQAQQERNKREAAVIEKQPALPPKKPAAPAIETGGDAGPEKKYSRRKHRRKKQIRKEKAEMRKAVEAAEQGQK